MAEAATILLTPQVVGSLIQLAGILIERCAVTRMSRFKDNLQTVKIDLGIINDVLKAIEAKNQRKLPDGIQAWKDEASDIVQEARELLGRIRNSNEHRLVSNQNEEINNPPPTKCLNCPFGNKNELRFNCQEARELKTLKDKLDSISKHNPTILQLVPRESGQSGKSRCSVM